MEPDEEAFLAEVARRSEETHEGWAEARWIESQGVFFALHWPWDRARSHQLASALNGAGFVSMMSNQRTDEVRLRLAGAVRATDDVGAALAEARAHLISDRIRAAGCIAGVELERRLKDLAVAEKVVISDPLPTLAVYNRVLYGVGIYSKIIMKQIDHLAGLRNLSAHVLDRDPTSAEVGDLIDGVETVLRSLEGARRPSHPN